MPKLGDLLSGRHYNPTLERLLSKDPAGFNSESEAL